MRYFLLFLIMIFSGSLLFSQGRDTRFVSVQTEEIKENATPFSRTLGSLAMGDSVSLARDDGRWAQVNAGTISGWVRSSSLTTRRVLPAGASAATAAEIALAGKGFSQEMEDENKRNGVNYSMVDYMETIVITPQELFIFIRDGHLSRGH